MVETVELVKIDGKDYVRMTSDILPPTTTNYTKAQLETQKFHLEEQITDLDAQVARVASLIAQFPA